MPTIAISAIDRNGRKPDHAIRAVEAAGGQVKLVTAATEPGFLDNAGGLLLADREGAEENTDAGLCLLASALAIDMPVLATGSGMHLLNTWFGGQPPQPVGNHRGDATDTGGLPLTPTPLPREERCQAGSESVRHQIYLSPGSKVAAIIGSAGMFRVNSRHRLGLREPQRAERLMTIAYQLDDGVIEGLESKEHSWVIGVQFRPELTDEVPANFRNLFLGLVERADAFSADRMR